MIKNLLKRRECGTYLATAHRHCRRLKMTMKAAVTAESYMLFIIHRHLESPAMSTGSSQVGAALSPF